MLIIILCLNIDTKKNTCQHFLSKNVKKFFICEKYMNLAVIIALKLKNSTKIKIKSPHIVYIIDT